MCSQDLLLAFPLGQLDVHGIVHSALYPWSRKCSHSEKASLPHTSTHSLGLWEYRGLAEELCFTMAEKSMDAISKDTNGQDL